MRVPAPDSKLTNTFRATEGWELVHSEASQCHQRGWVSQERLEQSQSKLSSQPQGQTFTDSLLPHSRRNEAKAVFIHRRLGRKMKGRR